MSDTKPRDILIGIPAHDHSLKVPTVSSLINGVIELAGAGMSMSLFVWSGDSLLTHARNVILAEFLKGESSDLVFVDSDVSWEAGALRRLVEHPVDFVAGVYRRKIEPEGYPVNYLDKPELRSDPETGLLEMRDVPMGFTRMSRSCVEQMTEASKGFPFRHVNAQNLQCYRVFDYEYHDGQYFGEDYVFCRKWRGLGGKVWVDPEMTLTHSGQKDYTGSFGEWLRNRHKTLTTAQVHASELSRAFEDAGINNVAVAAE